MVNSNGHVSAPSPTRRLRRVLRQQLFPLLEVMDQAPIYTWLVVFTPIKILVNGKDCPIYIMENKTCLKHFETTNQIHIYNYIYTVYIFPYVYHIVLIYCPYN